MKICDEQTATDERSVSELKLKTHRSYCLDGSGKAIQL